MNLSSLKNSSRSTEKLTQALNATQKKYQKDERYWELTVDKAGNGYAIIRFLDAPYVDGEDGLPFIQLWTHGFQGPGGWYIENSLTTLGQQDPVSEYNSALWNTGIEANKKIARDQKRQLNYISNILVVKDPANPENEGKVFLFRYGKEIFDKVQERLPGAKKAEGEFVDPDFVQFNPFNFWEGANFKLKARKKESGYRTYDKSEFAAQTAVGSDEEIEKLWKKSHSLKEILDVKNFKSYDQLKARLDKVLGHSQAAVSAPAAAAEATTVEEAVVTDDDDGMGLFKRLADDE